MRQSGRVLLLTACYLAVLIGTVVGTLWLTSASVSPLTLVIVIGGGIGVIAAVTVDVHLLRREGLRPAALGFTRPTGRLLHLLWQIPLIMGASVIVAIIVVGGLLQQEPAPSGTLDRIIESGSWPTLVGVLLVVAVVTPLWEEVLFRGLLFSSLTRTVPPIVAALISSAVWAAIHVVPAAMPYLFTFGLGSCWLYRRHGTLWAPIALHATNNALVTIAVVPG